MANLIWIVVILHVVIAVAVAGGIVVWRASSDNDRKNAEPEP